MPDRHSTGRDAPPAEEAVVTGDDLRRLVAQLPGTEERAHGGHPDFRVGGRIFACLSADEASAVVRLGLGEAAALAASRSGAAPLVSTRGSFGWVRLDLARVSGRDLYALLEEAWRLRAGGAT
ncbi:MAG TPA: MmcQ/YjbR family DNA-binding protein [Thermomicrobiales bacterium]|nr:MmcQ/YjbR family DNA-binding protein [Thermomicrobiales bacterium]